MLPVIDTHQHLWDLDRFHLSWLQRAPMLRRSFLPDDYRAAIAPAAQSGLAPGAAAGAAIVQSVFVEADVDAPEWLAEAEHVLALAASGEGAPIAGIVAAVRPEAGDYRRHLDRLAALGPAIKGVRRVLHTEPGGLGETPRFTENVRALADYGFSFDLCLRPSELGTALHLADACPNVAFILDHCGNPLIAAGPKSPETEAWRRRIHQIAQLGNVCCKISGIVNQAAPGRATAENLRPYVEHCIACFGWNRVLFGSDWPVCTTAASLADWLAALRHIVAGEDAENQRQLFSATAARVYRLPPLPAHPS